MDKLTQKESTSKPFFYLSELRKRLILIFIFFTGFFILGFSFSKPLADLFFRLFNLGSAQIVFTSPFQVFGLSVNIGIFLAIILSAPIFLYQLIDFIKPALTKKEKSLILPGLFVGFSLFVLGFSFGFTLMRWVVFEFSNSFSGGIFDHFYDVEQFLSQILMTSVFLGIIFEFPLVIYILIRLNLMDIKFLREKRPLIIAGIFILVALLPPSDGFSLIIMVLPVLLLFEISLFLLARKEVKQNVW